MTYKQIPLWAKVLYLHAQGRAKRRGMAFTVTKDEFSAIYRRAGGRCELSGLEFDCEKPKVRHGKRPFAASIDRIENSIGYTAENCRLVCVAANVAMNWWGSDVLLQLCAGIVDRHGRTLKYRQTAGLRSLAGVKVRPGKRSVGYAARIRVDGADVHLGTFTTPEDAHAAYLTARRAV